MRVNNYSKRVVIAYTTRLHCKPRPSQLLTESALSDYVLGSSKLDLRHLIVELRDVVDWFKLGVSLGIKHSNLKKIEADYRGNVERCKTEMLAFWMKNNGNASVEKLTQALEDIEHRNLARHLRDEYNVLQRGSDI